MSQSVDENQYFYSFCFQFRVAIAGRHRLHLNQITLQKCTIHSGHTVVYNLHGIVHVDRRSPVWPNSDSIQCVKASWPRLPPNFVTDRACPLQGPRILAVAVTSSTALLQYPRQPDVIELHRYFLDQRSITDSIH